MKGVSFAKTLGYALNSPRESLFSRDGDRNFKSLRIWQNIIQKHAYQERKEDHGNPNHIDFGCSPHVIAKALPKDGLLLNAMRPKSPKPWTCFQVASPPVLVLEQTNEGEQRPKPEAVTTEQVKDLLDTHLIYEKVKHVILNSFRQKYFFCRERPIPQTSSFF